MTVLAAVAAGTFTHRVADGLSARTARLLAAAMASMPKASQRPPLPVPEHNHKLPEPSDDEPAEQRPAPSARGTRQRPDKPRQTSTQSKARKGILVRRSAVRAAVRNGIRPSAVPVASHGDRPAGLQVHGWGAAGTALRDGDIITRVAGMAPRSVDDVIVAVAAAYRREVYAISGQVWRDGELYNVTVELPMPRGSASKPRTEPQRPASKSTGGPKDRSSAR